MAVRTVPILLGMLALTAALPLDAADYPARPVSFIVHSAPGSGTDVNARMVADILEREKLVPQRVLIENRTGGSGVAALNHVAGKTGDAYTVWLVAANIVIGQPLRAKLKVTYRDFTPIALLAKDPGVITVAAGSPYNSIRDFVAAAKERPKPFVAGVSSVGGAGHVTMAMFATGAGINFNYVFFKGGSESVVALAGGHIDVIAENPSEVLPLLQAKKVRALATATERRLPYLPDVPTLKEHGIDAVFEIGRGVFGPKDMPAEAVKYWEGVLEKMVRMPAWRKYVQDQQMVESFLNQAGFARFLDDMAGPLVQTMTGLGLLKD